MTISLSLREKLKHQVLLLLCLTALSGCGFKIESNESLNNLISGTITPLLGSIVQRPNTYSLITSAYAAVCSDPVYARIYEIQSDGSILEDNPIASQEVGPDAKYSFELKSLNLSTPNLTVRYIVRADGCNGNVYLRPVTDFNNKQDINEKTTVVSQVINLSGLISMTLNQVNRSDVEQLINSIQGSSSSSALHSITTDTAVVSKFTQIFGTAPNVIQDAKPIVTVTPPANVNELAPTTFNTTVFHVDPGYSFAYRWKIDGVVKASTQNWTFIPSANEQGFHQVDFYVGQNDGSGNIDISKPFYTTSFSVYVNNNQAPVAPVVVIDASTPSPRTANSITLSLNTGTSSANCASFSKMAITETNSAPGPLEFNIDCDTSITQLENVSFSSSNGTKTLYLWAQDASGEISAARTVSFVLDTIAPAVNFGSIASLHKGGSTYTLNYSAVDATTGIADLDVYISTDGTTYSLAASPALNATSVNLLIPSSDSTNMRFKIIAVDGVGFSTEIITSALEVDSTAPPVPSVTLASAVYTNSTSVSLTANCTNTPMLLINEGNAPTVSDTTWFACSGSFTHTLTSTTQGARNLKVWAKDTAGNVSSPATVSIVYDSVAPVLNLTSSPSGTMTGGSSVNVVFQVSELNITTSQSFVISYSTNGSSWNSAGTLAASNGPLSAQSFTFTTNLPSVDSTNFKFKVETLDRAGNAATVIQTSSFIVDSTGPLISNFKLNNTTTPGTITNNNLAVSFDVTDTITNVTKYCLKYNSATAPTSGDSCWVTLSSQGISPALNISVLPTDNIFYRIGYGSGQYDVYLWAIDNTGSITATPSLISLIYQAPVPPETSLIIAANTDSSLIPPSNTESLIPISNDLFIKWKTTGTIAGLSLEISYDEVTWTTLVASVTNSQGTGCTINANFSGCYHLPSGSPSSSYYRVRLKALGMDGSFSYSASNPINTGSFRVIAGNTSETLGGAAQSAVFIPSTVGDNRIGDATSMVVTPDGTIYLADGARGLLKINPSDGRLTVMIPLSATATGNGGPITSATVKLPSKLTLDHNNNLLLWDADTIRRINLSVSPATIQNIIGGGADTADNVAVATNLKITISDRSKRRTFFPLPDGKLFFETESNGEITGSKRYRLWDPATNAVSSFRTTGDIDIGTEIVQFGTCHKGSAVPLISAGVHTGFLIQYYQSNQAPCTPGKHILIKTDTSFVPVIKTTSPNANQIGSSIVLGKDRKAYFFAKDTRSTTSVSRYDPETDSWSSVIGNGQVGFCPDGTAILSCPMVLDDVFVSQNGKFYMIDNGMIRTVSDDGKMLTLYGKSGNNTLIAGKSPLTIQSSGISSMDVWFNSGTPTVVLMDNFAARIMEFTLTGSMTHLAGSGLQANPSTSVAATETSMNMIAGNSRKQHIAVDPDNGDIYATPANAGPYKLSRSTGIWVNYFGGATPYYSGDGTVSTGIAASNAKENGYGPLGIANNKVLFVHSKTVSTLENSVMVKGYNLTTQVQSSIIGSALNTGPLCADGTAIDNCPMQDANANSAGWPKIGYDGILNSYLFPNASKVRLVPAGGTGNISTLYDTTRTIRGMVNYRDGNGHLIVISCASDGRLYKWSNATNTQTTLTWPSSSIACQGAGMSYIPSRNSILFIFSQNNLRGIAEYLNP